MIPPSPLTENRQETDPGKANCFLTLFDKNQPVVTCKSPFPCVLFESLLTDRQIEEFAATRSSEGGAIRHNLLSFLSFFSYSFNSLLSPTTTTTPPTNHEQSCLSTSQQSACSDAEPWESQSSEEHSTPSQDQPLSSPRPRSPMPLLQLQQQQPRARERTTCSVQLGLSPV